MPRRIAQLGILILAAAALIFAWNLSLDYFDAFDILANARHLVGNGNGDYVWHRGLLAGPLFAPLALIERAIPQFPYFRAAHVLAVLFTLTLVGAVGRLARHVNPRQAWAAAFAFALNPLVVHYGVFAKEDIPSTLFTVLGFSQILTAGIGFAPLWFAAAGLLRPNLIPAIGLTLLLVRRTRHGTIRLYGGWALAMAAIAWLVYGWADLGGLPQVARDWVVQWRDNHQAYRPPSVAIALSGAVLPIVVLALAAAGAWRNEQPATRLAVIWAAVFLAVQTFLIPGKEARYFLPLLPALYVLAAAGTQSLPRWVAVAWWLCLPAGLLEIARFQDPIFREPRAERLAHWAEDQSKTGRVVWVGPFYPIRPAHHRIHEEDDYFALFHLWRNSVAFYLKREVPAIAYPETQTLDGEIFPKGLGVYLDSGDAILWNREPRSYATRDLPPALSPLVSARIEIHSATERAPSPGPFEIYDRTAEGLRSLGWVAEGQVPEGKWWLQLRGASEQPLNKTEYTPYTL